MSAALCLPQPPCTGIDDSTSATNAQYKYVPYDIFEINWLGKPQLLQTQTSPKTNHQSSNSRYAPGTLVWVLLSKGKPKQPKTTNSSINKNIGYNAQALHKKRRNKKNSRKQSNIDADGEEREEDANVNKKDDNDINNLAEETTTLNHSRKEFFLRARVISDDEEVISRTEDANTQTSSAASISDKQKYDDRRVLVRYSKGSTYHVRAYNLIPILEPSVQSTSLPPLVVVVPETNIYRRVAKVHTTPNDSFMEIGCDYGITCDKIFNSLLDGEVSKVWPPPKSEEEETGDTKEKVVESDKKESESRVSCLGIDKSINSINVANERYPKCKFALGDVLIPNEMTDIRTLCETSLINSAPSIVCIDVNGNREILGVLDCISSIMNEKWLSMPRMIIVKSRFLYWELKKEEGDGK